jgi:peptide/nickel transport system substrate-binding protein
LAKVRHGNGVLQEGIFAPTHPFFDPALRLVAFDVRAANKLLDDAGWQRGPDGIRAKAGTRLQFDYASGVGLPDTDQQIELIRATWKQIGADFTVQRYPSSTYFAPAQTGGILFGGKFDITNFAWYDAVDGNVQNLYSCDRIPPKGQNDLHYCDPAADRAMARILATYDPRAQIAAGHALQGILVNDAATFVLDIRKDTFAYNSDLQNFHPNQVTAFDDLRDVDI